MDFLPRVESVLIDSLWRLVQKHTSAVGRYPLEIPLNGMFRNYRVDLPRIEAERLRHTGEVAFVI